MTVTDLEIIDVPSLFRVNGANGHGYQQFWSRKQPPGLQVRRLKHLVELRSEKVTGTGTGDRYIGLENIQSWTGCLSESGPISEVDGTSIQFQSGDVLFGKLRPYLAKAAIAPFAGIGSSELLVLRPKLLTPEFLLYCLLNPGFINQVNSSTYGAKMPRANWDFIGNVPIAYPSIREQARICSHLISRLAAVDELIGRKQRLIEGLREKRTALITHAVTKGLTPNVPMKDSGVSWLGKIPAHWELYPLKQAADSIQTGPFGSQLHAEEYVENETPVINPANIVDGRIVPDQTKTVTADVRQRLQRHRMDCGDIVFARRGDMGRCALVTSKEAGWLCGTGSLRVRLKGNRAYPPYFSYYLGIRGVKEWLELESVGSTMDNLNTTILGRVVVPLIPLLEQRDIVEWLEKSVRHIETVMERVDRGVALLHAYRESLVSAAVTGSLGLSREDKHG